MNAYDLLSLSRLVDGRCYRYAPPMSPAAQLRIVSVALVRPGRLLRLGALAKEERVHRT
jgi:hypothetical protein